MNPETQIVVDRLELVERQNRTLKLTSIVALLLSVVAVAMAFIRPASAPAERARFSVVETQRLLIRDLGGSVAGGIETQTDGSVRTYSGSYTVNNGVITSASIVQTSGGSAAGQAPAGLTYAGSGVYAGPNTSAAFALSVEQAAAASGYASVITAYSPATGQSYTMTQASTSPYVYTGGNNALVQFDS